MSDVDIFDPDLYVEGPPHEELERLRETDPVHWQELDDGTGCWAILTHADVVEVAREPNLFSASEGGVVLEAVERDLIRQALERAEGNRTRAAALLGLSRDTLRYRIEKHGLE